VHTISEQVPEHLGGLRAALLVREPTMRLVPVCSCQFPHPNSHSLEHRVRNRNCRSRVLAGDKGAIDNDMRRPCGWRMIENRTAVLKRCLQGPRHPTLTDASLVLLIVSKRRHPIAVEEPQTVRSIAGR